VGTLAAAAIVTGAAGSSAHVAFGALAGEVPKVRVSHSGNSTEIRKAIPIAGRPARKERVVMTMTPHQLGDLRAGDRLLVSAELEVTTDCLPRQRPRGRHRRRACAGRPYRYAPVARAVMLLADDGHDTGGEGTVPLTPTKRITCRQKPPDREHHCMIVFVWAHYSVPDASFLPCPPRECFLNVVANAHHPNAHRGDRLIVGADEPKGRTTQDKGRINVVRERPASSAAGVFSGNETSGSVFGNEVRLRRFLPLRRRVVVYSQRLDDLEAGEQIAVRARTRISIARIPRNALVTARLILAEAPDATTRGELVKEIAGSGGAITEGNGFNCTEATTPCWTNKVGVLLMESDAMTPAGEPQPLYVNLVVGALAHPGRLRAGRAIRALREGGIEVVRYGSDQLSLDGAISIQRASWR
jgi:hypothetical protein